MALNASGATAYNTFMKIQDTCKGVVISIKSVFVQYHSGALTYERIYNDFIPKIRTAINALPASEDFSESLKVDLNALASIMCGAESYIADYQALEILLDELLALAVASIPVDSNGFALVIKGADGSSDTIPEMLEISNKLDAIYATIG
jgi:hypothetical protein